MDNCVKRKKSKESKDSHVSEKSKGSKIKKTIEKTKKQKKTIEKKKTIKKKSKQEFDNAIICGKDIVLNFDSNQNKNNNDGTNSLLKKKENETIPRQIDNDYFNFENEEIYHIEKMKDDSISNFDYDGFELLLLFEKETDQNRNVYPDLKLPKKEENFDILKSTSLYENTNRAETTHADVVDPDPDINNNSEDQIFSYCMVCGDYIGEESSSQLCSGCF